MTLDERFERLQGAAIALWGSDPGSVQIIVVAKRPTPAHVAIIYEALLMSTYGFSGSLNKIGSTANSADRALTALEKAVAAEIALRRDHLVEVAPEFDP